MSDKPKEGDLRVWWIPQIPMKSFYTPVDTLTEAKLILDTLARYDLFQLKNNIKPDYSNTGGLQIFNEIEGWIDFYNEEGTDIDGLSKEEITALDAARAEAAKA